MRMAYNFSGAQGCSCGAESASSDWRSSTSSKAPSSSVHQVNEPPRKPLTSFFRNGLFGLVTMILEILKQYFGNTLLFIKKIFSLCLNVWVLANILELLWKGGNMTPLGQGRDYHSQTNVMAEWGRRNNCTKVEGGGVSVNTYYFTILFRRCFATVVNQLWECVESVQKMWEAQYVRQRYKDLHPYILFILDILEWEIKVVIILKTKIVKFHHI